MGKLCRLLPAPASYVFERNCFEATGSVRAGREPSAPARREAARWGELVPLGRAGEEFDPQGLYFVHHGVGSEHWSADGFTPAAS